MITVRQGAFETNSSSCHVLTIATDEEREQLLSGERLIFVDSYSCDDEDSPYNSEIVDKVRLREIAVGLIGQKEMDESHITEDILKEIIDAIFVGDTEFWKVMSKYKDAMTPDAWFRFDSIFYHCHHEQGVGRIFDTENVKIKTAHGIKFYCSFWRKSC